jgi:F-type H+-transporting ATPase subunit a
MFFNPLEQFEIHQFFQLSLFKLIDISFTNLTYTLILVIDLIILFFVLTTYKLTLIPSPLQALAEILYKFIYSLLLQQTGKKGQAYFPLVFAIFFFVLFANLIGLLPFGFTVTAQFLLTFTLAFALNFGLIVIGFIEHNIYFLKKFFPTDTPMWLLPFLSIIEIVSYLIRTLSLSIRLFANMLAGHALMHIISSAFVNAIFKLSGFFIIISTFVILAVMVLETGIGFLQAYVFTILFCIYLSESLEIGH